MPHERGQFGLIFLPRQRANGAVIKLVLRQCYSPIKDIANSKRVAQSVTLPSISLSRTSFGDALSGVIVVSPGHVFFHILPQKRK